jgi:hypothetical protein
MCETLKGRFESLREDYRNMHECCYQGYVRCVEAGVKNDPKKFFEFVDMEQKCVGYLSSMYFAVESASGSENICNLFARFFWRSICSMQTQMMGLKFSVRVGGPAILSSLSFTVEDVERRLLGLDVSKGSGPDEIPPRILKSCSDGCKRSLTLLFNRSLSEGVFLDSWK